MSLKNKTALITGASRGIGKAIALKLAAAGANIVIAAKTESPHPKLEGTIYSAADEVRNAGGGGVLPVPVDIRNEETIRSAVEQAVARFGGIDILVNNASAIDLSPAEQIVSKRFDLMQAINVRGTFLMCQACIPYLKQSSHAHILNLSPPLNMDKKWFSGHLPYTISKYGMSMIVLGLAGELEKYEIAANALWPRTTIATAAVRNLLGGEELIQRSRKPDIVADAALLILQQAPRVCTGNFFIDEEVLAKHGINEFDQYAVDPAMPLAPDLFL